MTGAQALREAASRAAGLIAEADGLVVTAGAGMGVDSGLPDFRGTTGFWRAYPALARAQVRFESIASPAAFERDPELAWGFYGHRLALYRRTAPHAGFRLLGRWSETMAQGGFVFTSNVDGQFQAAGFPEGRVHECHGSLRMLQFSVPCGQAAWPADGLEPELDEPACRWLGALPSCPRCGSLARPNVLMFDDGEWLDTRYALQRKRLANWLEGVRRPVVVECGAGTRIPSVRLFGEQLCWARHARLVRINPREHEVPLPGHVSLETGALGGLAAIDEALKAG